MFILFFKREMYILTLFIRQNEDYINFNIAFQIRKKENEICRQYKSPESTRDSLTVATILTMQN